MAHECRPGSPLSLLMCALCGLLPAALCHRPSWELDGNAMWHLLSPVLCSFEGHRSRCCPVMSTVSSLLRDACGISLWPLCAGDAVRLSCATWLLAEGVRPLAASSVTLALCSVKPPWPLAHGAGRCFLGAGIIRPSGPMATAVPERPPHSRSTSGTFQMLTGVPLSAQEVLENLKDRWYQADNPPSDLLLTEDEFLSFLHPEHSRGMLKFMVKEIVRDLGEARPGQWGLMFHVQPALLAEGQPGLVLGRGGPQAAVWPLTRDVRPGWRHLASAGFPAGPVTRSCLTPGSDVTR